MAWRTTVDPERYAERAGPFLRSRPVENTVPLTVSEGLRARCDPDAAPLLGWWEDDGGAVTGACLWTPPRPPLLTAMPDEAARALVEVLAGDARPVVGLNATASGAGAFARAWNERTCAAVVAERGLRLHRLDALVPPDPPPPGRAVHPSADRTPLLVTWYQAFGREVGEPVPVEARHVEDRLAAGGLLLWEAGGEPVSLAGMTRPVAGAVRVAPVFTPPEHRGRGYAAAATAAVTRAALDAGAAEVLLYTDLANETTNRLYARLGFVPVEDRVAITFG
jgi:GNAT superfamily N-acetyltransferase